jgi:hypothetical protein
MTSESKEATDPLFEDTDVRLIHVMPDDTMSVVLDFVGRKSILPLWLRNRMLELQMRRKGGGFVITVNTIARDRISGEIVGRVHGKRTICIDDQDIMIEFLLKLIIKSNNQDLDDGQEECCVEMEFPDTDVKDSIIQQFWIPSEGIETRHSAAYDFKQNLRRELRDTLLDLGEFYKFDRAS